MISTKPAFALLLLLKLCASEPWNKDPIVQGGANEDLVWIEQTARDASPGEKFPATVSLYFFYQNSPIYFDLVRDDKMTRQLNPSIFEASRALPNNLMTWDNQEDFAFYHNKAPMNASDRVSFVFHRDSTDTPSRIYGHFLKDSEILVVSPHGDSYNQHRVRRDADRSKRVDLTGTNIIEVAVWIAPDFRFYLQKLSGFSKNSGRLRGYIREYATALIRDVDTIFKIASRVFLRAYMLESSYNTDDSAETWTTDNLVGTDSDKLKADDALSDFVTYIKTLDSAIIMPNYDHIVALTRYNLVTDDGVDEEMISKANVGTMCSADTQSSASIVEVSQSFYLKGVAQGILQAAGQGFGSSSSLYVMGTDYTTIPDSSSATLPWKLRKTTQTNMNNLINAFTTNCLITQEASDSELQAFYEAPTYGQLYDPDQQCATIFNKDSVACSTVNNTICYEGITCTDVDASDSCTLQLFVGDRTRCTTTDEVFQCRTGECIFDPLTSSSTPSPSTSPTPSTSTSSPSPSTSTSSPSPSTSTSSPSPSTSTSSPSPSTSTSSPSPSTSTSSPSPSTSTSSPSPTTTSTPVSTEEMAFSSTPIPDVCPPQRLGKVTVTLDYTPCPLDNGKCPKHVCADF